MMQNIPITYLNVVFIAIGAVVVYFLIYMLRLRYPPMVRKIRDFKFLIRRRANPSTIVLKKILTRQQLHDNLLHDIKNNPEQYFNEYPRKPQIQIEFGPPDLERS